MTPTNKLRILRRVITPGHTVTLGLFDNHTVAVEPVIKEVLQQWWAVEGDEHEDYLKAGGEWRDVPMEDEV
jgi:hypothetical protein